MQKIVYNKSTIICGVILLFLVILIIMVFILYLRAKRNLKAEEIAIKEQLEQDRKRFQKEMEERERELLQRKNVLEENIKQFHREEALREDISQKNNRDVIVELYIKTLKTLQIATSIEAKAKIIEELSEKYDDIERSIEELSEKVNFVGRNVERRVLEITKTIENNMDGSSEELDSRIMEKLDDISEDISNISYTVREIDYKLDDE